MFRCESKARYGYGIGSYVSSSQCESVVGEKCQEKGEERIYVQI